MQLFHPFILNLQRIPDDEIYISLYIMTVDFFGQISAVMELPPCFSRSFSNCSFQFNKCSFSIPDAECIHISQSYLATWPGRTRFPVCFTYSCIQPMFLLRTALSHGSLHLHTMIQAKAKQGETPTEEPLTSYCPQASLECSIGGHELAPANIYKVKIISFHWCHSITFYQSIILELNFSLGLISVAFC